MTLMEILNRGDITQLGLMIALIVLWIIMLFRIGKGVAARAAAEKKPFASAASKKDEKAVVAAISAAVKEYRKNN